MGAQGHLRIGELSQRTGISPELLRAWERRYGLLKPARSAGGFRLYSGADEARVRRMKGHLAQGLAAAEAARIVEQVVPDESPPIGLMEVLRADLRRSLEAFDESGGHRALDSAFGSFSLDGVILELLIPYLNNLGERWARNEVTVAQEHFASNLIRARMLALGRNWDAGYGPRALLACPEGELHDLGIILFGVALGSRGWRITFLGANTPLPTVISTARDLRPNAVVVAVTDPAHLANAHRYLVTLARDHRLILAGRGVDGVAASVGAELFNIDPVSAAERLAAPPIEGAEGGIDSFRSQGPPTT
ncbi:MAG TPA: B12-binding domain-containing protein [Actinomycetota bacterium]|nr:B12-binding domain-containing protein [Actinomycetota bacterium]